MTSHISVSVTPAAGGAASGFSPLGQAARAGAKTGFAALLATVGANGGAAGDAAKALQSLLQPATDGSTALAVPLAATADTDAASMADDAPTTGAAAGVMKELVDALAELQKALQSGQTPTDDLLKRVKQAVDAVANVLTTQPQLVAAPASGTSDGSTVTVSGATTDDTGSAPSDGAARVRLAALDQKLTQLAGDVAATHPDVTQKLADLAKTLDPDKLNSGALAQLGLGDGDTAPAETSLANALTALTAPPSPSTVPAAQPTLAAPQLKLPVDSTLTAAPADKPAPNPPPAIHTLTAAAVPAPQHPASGDSGGSKDPHDQKAAADAVAAAGAAASTPADKSAPPASTASGAPMMTGTAPAPAATSTALAASAAYQTALATPLNVPQLAIDIARQAHDGTTHFQMRLDPAELGRVDVKLSIDGTGATTAHLTVERPDTLDLLRRDQSQLGAALSQAGLDAGKTNLQFSLSQNPFTRQDAGAGTPAHAGPTDANDMAEPVTPVATAAYRTTLAPQGLNIIV